MTTRTRILIVGGVAGGMSAAARARRINEHAAITVIERGGFISFANCGLPYHIAGRIASQDKLLVTTAARVKERFNIDTRLHTEATRINRQAKTLEVRHLTTGISETLPYDKLILAPGAGPVIPPIPHVDAPNAFFLRNMEDTRRLQQFLATRQPQTAAIIGAGFIGLEMAEALHDRGLAVTLVERVDHPLPPLDREMTYDLERELRGHRIQLVTGVGLESLTADAGGHVTAVALQNGQSIPADLVLLSLGVRPNVALARDAGLTLGPTGGIAVDTYQRTNDPDIYAVGDVAEVTHGVTGKTTRIPLAGPANKQGRLAGEHAASGASATAAPSVLGTAIVQVFSLSVGLTGLGEAAARQAGFDVDTAYVAGADHASYYPGAQPLRIKLIYDRATGRVLGGQISGRAGVDKRLDVLATLLHFRGTIDDLAALDLAYAPQFGSAKDPLHMAAFVAQNQRRALTPALRYAEARGLTLIDVRTPEEFARGTLPGAVSYPLDTLRARPPQSDKSKPLAIFCQVGLRGHVATRLLAQMGYDVRNIKGGYALASEEAH